MHSFIYYFSEPTWSMETSAGETFLEKKKNFISFHLTVIIKKIKLDKKSKKNKIQICIKKAVLLLLVYLLEHEILCFDI